MTNTMVMCNIPPSQKSGDIFDVAVLVQIQDDNVFNDLHGRIMGSTENRASD